VDLRAPLDADALRVIDQALTRHGVLVFPDQPIDDQDHERFARGFGELGVFRRQDSKGGVHPIFRAGNSDPDGNLLPANSERVRLLMLNWAWHIDSSYRTMPTRGTILRAIQLADEGGDTMFANMVAAYDEMPEELKQRTSGLYARHSFEFLVRNRGLPAMDAADLARLPPVEHPLVRRLADGRCSLYLSPPYMETIVGWDQESSRALIEELTEWATQDRFTYRHQWRRKDVLMWNNGWTMHVVTPYDLGRQKRVMHGTTLPGTEPILPARIPTIRS